LNVIIHVRCRQVFVWYNAKLSEVKAQVVAAEAIHQVFAFKVRMLVPAYFNGIPVFAVTIDFNPFEAVATKSAYIDEGIRIIFVIKDDIPRASAIAPLAEWLFKTTFLAK
jgi:hypothetical protein